MTWLAQLGFSFCRYMLHRASRNDPPKDGQTWVTADCIRIEVYRVLPDGNISLSCGDANDLQVNWCVTPAGWRELVSRNRLALTNRRYVRTNT